MMYEDFRGFWCDRKKDIIPYLVAMAVALAGVWLVYDRTRNEPVYNDTDSTVGKLEERISSLEQRIDTMSKRLAETQKTVNAIGDRVNASTGLAKEIESGLGTAETRLDRAVQRAGIIQNIISDIEATNRPGTQNP